jgi:hypothetical protein
MLKRYYSINDAADFLNFELKQNLNASDILEIAARGQIRLCIWFDGLVVAFLYDLPESRAWGPPHDFRGYIKIPSEKIRPSGGIVYFESIEIAEVVKLQSSEEFKLPYICSANFWGTYTCDVETGDIKCHEFKTNINDAVIPTEDILALLSTSPKKEASQINATNQHKSNMLMILNQASNKFWANINKNDPGTYPKKVAVVAWLEENGFSQTLAEKGATIIRPEWVPVGRRPEE